MKQHSFEKRSVIEEPWRRSSALSQPDAAHFVEKAEFWRALSQLRDLGNAGAVLAVVQAAARQWPDDPEIAVERALCLLQSGAPQAAQAQFERLAALLPDECWPMLYRAEACAQNGLTEKAMAALAVLKEKFEPQAVGRQDVLHLFERAAMIEKAFPKWKSALCLDPHDDDLLQKVWLSVELKGNHVESALLHEHLLDLAPRSFRAWFNLGSAYEQLGRSADALEAYEFSFLIEPRFQAGWLAFANLCALRGEHERALRFLGEMLRFLPPTAPVLVLMGERYDSLRQPQLARSFYRNALSSDSKSADARFRLGSNLLDDGQHREAIELLESAVRLESRRDDFHAALAEAHRSVGDFKKAAHRMRRAIYLAPDEAKYWLQYAAFFMAEGKFRKALKTLSDAEANEVFDAGLLYCRAVCHLQLGERDEAFGALDSALMDDFSMHSSLFELAPELIEDADLLAHIAQFEPH